MKPNKPYVLGLTGGIACGKSYVARLLRQRGIPVLDADAISRSLTAPAARRCPPSAPPSAIRYLTAIRSTAAPLARWSLPIPPRASGWRASCTR